MVATCTGAKAHRWKTLKVVTTVTGRRLLQTCEHCPEFQHIDTEFWVPSDPREDHDRWLDPVGTDGR